MALAAIVSGAGWLVVASAEADTTTSSDAHASSPVAESVAAAVDAAGIPLTPTDGWAVRRAGPGTYELSFSRAVRVDVRTWEAPAGVTIRPVADRVWSIAFVADGTPVDTGFSFQAAPTGA